MACIRTLPSSTTQHVHTHTYYHRLLLTGTFLAKKGPDPTQSISALEAAFERFCPRRGRHANSGVRIEIALVTTDPSEIRTQNHLEAYCRTANALAARFGGMQLLNEPLSIRDCIFAAASRATWPQSYS
jgi:hypothetical protein